jgi:K+-transporting ATPase ATPase C chain
LRRLKEIKTSPHQVLRIAEARGIDQRTFAELVRKHIQDRKFGIFGEPTVNVLRLNMAMDALR